MRDYNMQNVFIWIVNKFKKGGFKYRYVNNPERGHNYLRLQIDNSLRLGWDKSDIIPITNFPFEHMGVKAYEVESDNCKWSAFANRMVAVNEMIQRGIIEDNFWVHDLDAYQLQPFVFPKECKDVGFAKHAVGRNKPQGASAFYRKEAFDIVDVVARMIMLFRPPLEEGFFPYFYQEKGGKKVAKRYADKLASFQERLSKVEDVGKKAKLEEKIEQTLIYSENANKYFGKFEDRFSWLNYTYNLCQQRMFNRKYPKAEKPIKVVHFKVEHPSTLNCFYKGKNSHNAQVVTDEVGELFFKYNLLPEKERR